MIDSSVQEHEWNPPEVALGSSRRMWLQLSATVSFNESIDGNSESSSSLFYSGIVTISKHWEIGCGSCVLTALDVENSRY